MDEQSLTTFEDNLRTLLRLTKRISPERENLTPEEIRCFSHIEDEVQKFITGSTEIHTKYFGQAEPGWLASSWSSITSFSSSWMAPILLFFFHRIQQAHQKSCSRADGIFECPQRIGRDKFYS
jgi:hypothetical protein